MRRALAFMAPFIADKTRWPHARDVQYHDEWPMRHPALLFGGLALDKPDYVDIWKTLKADIPVLGLGAESRYYGIAGWPQIRSVFHRRRSA